jgi:hypothetical protein
MLALPVQGAMLPTYDYRQQVTVCQGKDGAIMPIPVFTNRQSPSTLEGRAVIAHRAEKPQGSADSALRYTSYPLRLILPSIG